jgi:8-oxo-dGTP pyrophosphatase MutT (NUDIX family)
MDSSRDFEIWVSGVFDRSRVVVSWRDASRLRSSDEQAEIDVSWTLALASANRPGRPPLFDGALFRVDRADVRDGVLSLELSNTTYREYVGTRRPELRAMRGQELLADPLAVCLVAETLDGYLLVERRGSVDAHAGSRHVIGGFAERTVDVIDGLPAPFLAIERECIEETGFRPEAKNLRVIGLTYDRVIPHPELCFAGRVDATLAEIRAGAGTRDEFHRVETLRAEPGDVLAFLAEPGVPWSPTGRAALLLWGRVRWGEDWYARGLASGSLPRG